MSGNPARGGRGGRGDRGGGRGDTGSGRGGGGRGGTQNIPFHPRGGSSQPRGPSGPNRGGPSGGRGGGFFSYGTPITVDTAVAKIEDDTVKSNPPKQIDFPHRPGFGSKGKEILLYANYFKLSSNNNVKLNRYDIEIKGKPASTPVPVGKKLKRVVQLLIQQLGKADVATDYKKYLISKSELEESVHEIAYFAEDSDEPSDRDPTYLVRLQHTGSFKAADLVEHLSSTQASGIFESKGDLIQALNIVLGHHPKTDTTVASVGSNRHFDLNAPNSERRSLGAGLEAIRGFLVSVRAATGRILLNVQVKNLAFYESGPAEQIIKAFTNNKASLSGGDLLRLSNFLKKVNVNVTHIKKKNKAGREMMRIKSIQGLASPDDGRNQPHPPIVPRFGAGAKEVKFFLEATTASGAPAPAPDAPAGKKGGKKPPKAGPSTAGEYITVSDFFKRTYNITIRDLNCPVLRFGTRDRPTYLPAQVCEVIPGQAASAKLSPAQTQNMIKHAVRRPHLNAQSVAEDGRRLLGCDPTCKTLNEFGLSTGSEMIIVPGRILNGPIIKYGGKNTINPRFGSWNMKNVQFVTRSKISSWAYLHIAPDNQGSFAGPDHFQDMLANFTGMLRLCGIETSATPPSGFRIAPRQDLVETEVDNAFKRFAADPARRPQLVFVVISDGSGTPVTNAVYNRVKVNCDVTHGFHSVCVLESKFARSNDQYWANVALKFNLKLGGINHSLDPSKLGIVGHKKTMIVGIDVTHPSPGSVEKAPSVAGIVASVDQWLAQWPADLRVQAPRQEMVDSLDVMFKGRLAIWKAKNGAYPDNIIVYRDGVSEGQYSIVLERELPSLQRACKELYPATATKAGLPKITVIIVSKRHNTRFYVAKEADADRSGNPSNGMVVDRSVTEARNWDFFLQSHSAIQGTARPTHYYVVHDEIFRGNRDALGQFQTAADALHDLTHNMCYLYGRATKAVRVTPPVYYADLVCERARKYLSGYFDPSPAATPAGSVAASNTTGTTRVPDNSEIQPNPLIRNSMFYI